MKPLILSFFAVILAYSFFFDKEDKNTVPSSAAGQKSAMRSEAPERTDTVTFYARRFHIAPECLPQATPAKAFTLLR